METEKQSEVTDADLIPVYIMGKQYMVPPTLTIMKAMEYAGYKLIRGVGCRGGFCGACGTAYRVMGDPKRAAGPVPRPVPRRLTCGCIWRPG
jgi:ferredoxin